MIGVKAMEEKNNIEDQALALYNACVKAYEDDAVEFAPNWKLPMDKSCEAWLRGYFNHSKDRKLVNACVELLKSSHIMNIKNF